jgi:sugar phosphate isomerase/epimerase
MRPLALHQLTALDATPLELVTLAAESGCQRIVTWVHDPLDPFPGTGWPQFGFPSITPETQAEMKLRLNDNGIELANIEMFPIAPLVDVNDYRKYFEMGADMNAARTVVHIHDHDENRALEMFGRFCEMAAEYNIGAGVEFMGLVKACKTLDRALFFVQKIDMPNVGVALDFLHCVRTGATVEDIRAVPAKYISYAQICDGPGLQVTDDYLEEGLNRLAAGTGDWPVREIVQAMPAEVPIDVETPLTTMKDQGVPVKERVKIAVDAARAIVDSVTPER